MATEGDNTKGPASVETKQEGSFVRWQSVSITQLGYAINLFLGFATAALGFSLSLVKDKDFVPDPCGKRLLLLSLLLLALSALFGIWCVINRLRDFRKTKDIARDREEWEEAKLPPDLIKRRLAERRRETKRLGTCTWILFCCQILAFSLGVLALIATFFTVYHTKLF